MRRLHRTGYVAPSTMRRSRAHPPVHFSCGGTDGVSLFNALNGEIMELDNKTDTFFEENGNKIRFCIAVSEMLPNVMITVCLILLIIY